MTTATFNATTPFSYSTWPLGNRIWEPYMESNTVNYVGNTRYFFFLFSLYSFTYNKPNSSGHHPLYDIHIMDTNQGKHEYIYKKLPCRHGSFFFCIRVNFLLNHDCYITTAMHPNTWLWRRSTNTGSKRNDKMHSAQSSFFFRRFLFTIFI